jgi:hypothetical protein
MPKAVAATDRNDLVDLISRIELELSSKAFRIRRLLRRRSLQPDDRFPVLNRQEAGELVALVDTLEPEQLIAGPLGVLVRDIHDRVKLHPLLLAHLGRKRHTRIRSRSVTTSERQ